MDINEAFDFLNFWISKERGAFYTVPELELLIDRGQMSYYTDIKTKYSTSTLIKEILSPFKRTYAFTPSNSISGYVVVPSDVDYLDFLDMQIEVDISSRILYNPVEIMAEDSRAYRLNSQVDPVTVSNPVAEIMAPRYFKMYPAAGYRGIITYLARPVAPVFGYSVISGRVIVYNPLTSTQLQWRDSDIVPILLKSLQSVGINLTSADVSQFAAMKTAENYQNVNRL